jgi:hypothetical protein
MEMGGKLNEMNNESSEWIRKNLEKLSSAGFKEIIEEHERLRKENKRRYFQWYSLFNGPSSFNKLLQTVLKNISIKDGGADANSFIYGRYSNTMHGVDLYIRMSSEKKKTMIQSFRTFNSVDDFITGYGYAARMTVFSLFILLRRNCTNSKKRGTDFWIKNLGPRLKNLDRFCK